MDQSYTFTLDVGMPSPERSGERLRDRAAAFEPGAGAGGGVLARRALREPLVQFALGGGAAVPAVRAGAGAGGDPDSRGGGAPVSRAVTIGPRDLELQRASFPRRLEARAGHRRAGGSDGGVHQRGDPVPRGRGAGPGAGRRGGAAPADREGDGAGAAVGAGGRAGRGRVAALVPDVPAPLPAAGGVQPGAAVFRRPQARRSRTRRRRRRWRRWPVSRRPGRRPRAWATSSCCRPP